MTGDTKKDTKEETKHHLPLPVTHLYPLIAESKMGRVAEKFRQGFMENSLKKNQKQNHKKP